MSVLRLLAPKGCNGRGKCLERWSKHPKFQQQI